MENKYEVHDAKPSLATCHAANLCAALSPLRPRIVFQGLYHLKGDGVLPTLRLIAGKLRAMGRRRRPTTNTHGRSDEVALHLQPGELVEVKSESEIRDTLDASGRLRGLLFLPQMREFCGKKFRVHRRLERMVLEHSGEIRRLTNTVLLENVFCDGVASGCDRSCFLYWREAWLRRPAAERAPGAHEGGE